MDTIVVDDLSIEGSSLTESVASRIHSPSKNYLRSVKSEMNPKHNEILSHTDLHTIDQLGGPQDIPALMLVITIALFGIIAIARRKQI